MRHKNSDKIDQYYLSYVHFLFYFLYPAPLILEYIRSRVIQVVKIIRVRTYSVSRVRITLL